MLYDCHNIAVKYSCHKIKRTLEDAKERLCLNLLITHPDKYIFVGVGYWQYWEFGEESAYVTRIYLYKKNSKPKIHKIHSFVTKK